MLPIVILAAVVTIVLIAIGGSSGTWVRAAETVALGVMFALIAGAAAVALVA